MPTPEESERMIARLRVHWRHRVMGNVISLAINAGA
jgi:hypothetical protein